MGTTTTLATTHTNLPIGSVFITGKSGPPLVLVARNERTGTLTFRRRYRWEKLRDAWRAAVREWKRG